MSDTFGFGEAEASEIVRMVMWWRAFKQAGRGGVDSGSSLHHRRQQAALYELIGDVNPQSGTSYDIQESDWGKEIDLSNSGTKALTIAEATLANGFPDLWWCVISNSGGAVPGGLATLTPTTSAVDGAATAKIRAGDSVVLRAGGGNYRTEPGTNLLRARKNSGSEVGRRPRFNFIEGTNVTLTVADDNTDDEIGITIAATGGSSSLTVAESDGSPSYGSITTLQVKATSYVLTQPSANNALISPGWGLLADISTVGTKAAGTSDLHARADHVHDLPTVPVSSGGTGATTLGSHGTLIGHGTSAVTAAGPGTSGYVLASNGASADPTYQDPASLFTGVSTFVQGTGTTSTSFATVVLSNRIGRFMLVNQSGNTITWQLTGSGAFTQAGFDTGTLAAGAAKSWDMTADLPGGCGPWINWLLEVKSAAGGDGFGYAEVYI